MVQALEACKKSALSEAVEAHQKKDRGHQRAAMPWGGVGVGLPHTCLDLLEKKMRLSGRGIHPGRNAKGWAVLGRSKAFCKPLELKSRAFRLELWSRAKSANNGFAGTMGSREQFINGASLECFR